MTQPDAERKPWQEPAIVLERSITAFDFAHEGSESTERQPDESADLETQHE